MSDSKYYGVYDLDLDFDLLRQQKKSLEFARETAMRHIKKNKTLQQVHDDLEGLLQIIDEIQDQAVSHNGFDIKEVFGEDSV